MYICSKNVLKRVFINVCKNIEWVIFINEEFWKLLMVKVDYWFIEIISNYDR